MPTDSASPDTRRRMPTYCMAPYRLTSIGSTTVPCQRPRGHEGPHRYEVIWFDVAEGSDPRYRCGPSCSDPGGPHRRPCNA